MQAAEKAGAAGQSVHHEAGDVTPGNVLIAMLAVYAIGQERTGRRANR